MKLLGTNCLVLTSTTIQIASCYCSIVAGYVSSYHLLPNTFEHQNAPRTSTFLESVNSRNAEFEYQEMKVLLDALKREKVVSSNRIDRVKANELNQYIKTIVSDRVSSSSSDISLSASDRQQQQQQQQLYNTSWTMMYTTMDILPPDTTIQLQFFDSSRHTNDIVDATTITGDYDNRQKIQYRLLFGSKTFGLNALNMNCDWTAPSPMSYVDNNNNMMVSFTYDTISMDAFGWKNIHLCFISNLFRGRTNMINTVYFDGTIWIEQQESMLNGSNNNDENYRGTTQPVIWNVYRKDQLPEEV